VYTFTGDTFVDAVAGLRTLREKILRGREINSNMSALAACGGGVEQITTTSKLPGLRYLLMFHGVQYTVKKVCRFPVPSRDVTNQTLPGRI
jgi:hypothetical protein